MERAEHDARLDDRDEIVLVHVDDAVERVRREDDSARDGDRAARATRARRTRRDGDLVRVGDAKNGGDVLARLGDDDDVRHARFGLAVVLGVDAARGFVEHELRLTYGAIQIDERALDARGGHARNLRSFEQHSA